MIKISQRGRVEAGECMIIISDAEPSDISYDNQQMCSSPKRLRSDGDTVWMCTDKMCFTCSV